MRWLLGLNYTLPGGLNFIAEYSHASDALASGEWQRYLDQVRFSGAAFESGAYPPLSNGRSLPELNLLLAMQGLGSGSLGRDYGFIRVARTYRVPAVESSVLAFANLRDGSLALVPEFSVRVQRRMTVYGRATFPIGSKESEFGNIPIARSANLGLRVAF